MSTYATSWKDYETNFITALKEIKESGTNIGVFGDIDIDDHKNLLKIFEKRGVDLAGENGEYHTMVTGGPIFTNDIEYKLEEKIFFNGYWFQNLSVEK